MLRSGTCSQPAVKKISRHRRCSLRLTSRSQQHLLAISNRSQIAETITDVLVRRGNREVVRNVAGNSGARLSLNGFSTLVLKAEKDGILAEKVGQRADIPEPLLRVLFIHATQVVQRRLEARTGL